MKRSVHRGTNAFWAKIGCRAILTLFWSPEVEVILFFGDFWSFQNLYSKISDFDLLIVSFAWNHMEAIDIDNIGFLEPFLPLWEHFWNWVSATQLGPRSDTSSYAEKLQFLGRGTNFWWPLFIKNNHRIILLVLYSCITIFILFNVFLGESNSFWDHNIPNAGNVQRLLC